MPITTSTEDGGTTGTAWPISMDHLPTTRNVVTAQFSARDQLGRHYVVIETTEMLLVAAPDHWAPGLKSYRLDDGREVTIEDGRGMFSISESGTLIYAGG